MTDEISLGGTQYVLSKRAAQSSGYSQDYVGQLARGGYIDAQRVGGLWYVNMDSLLRYKQDAEAAKPEPPAPKIVQDPETLVFFDGKEFISASRASDLSGYTQDYVGQLARGGKILSRQVGTRWYVDKDALLAHKREKDALLAAVQSNAVGLRRPEQNLAIESPQPSSPEVSTHFTYKTEEADLMPRVVSDRPVNEAEVPVDIPESHSIPIHVVRETANHTSKASAVLHRPQMASQTAPLVHPIVSSRLALMVAIIAVVAVSGTVAYLGNFYRPGSFAIGETDRDNTAASSALANSYEKVSGFLERVLVPELVYTRKRTQ